MTYNLYDRPILSTHLIMTPSTETYPRIRDLPPEEQEPFRAFLCGQTRPLIDFPQTPWKDQDYYFSGDYENFKRKPKDRFFD